MEKKHGSEHTHKEHYDNIKCGKDGRDGKDGKDGKDGYDGKNGKDGKDGKDGKRGHTGKRGHKGECGKQGPAGHLAASDFYALMPGDNAATVAPATDVQFPNNGPTTGLITRAGLSTFILPNIGLYSIQFQVSVTEAAQLCVALNLVELPYTVVGRDTGTSQLYGTCLVRTSTANSIISIRNPASSTSAITITPVAGGPTSVSAHLVILQIA